MKYYYVTVRLGTRLQRKYQASEIEVKMIALPDWKENVKLDVSLLLGESGWEIVSVRSNA